MAFMMDYIRSVMEKDQSMGMELLRLNEKHLQAEVEQMRIKLEQEKSNKKNCK